MKLIPACRCNDKLRIRRFHEKERDIREQQEQVSEVQAAADQLARLFSRIDFENGHVSWTREMLIAQQRLEEAVMWAIKAIKCERFVAD